MAEERMKHPPVSLNAEMMAAIERTIGKCAADSPWKIAAGSIEPTHVHLLITYSRLNIDRTLKWLAQEMTKATHRETTHTGPLWCEGKWCSGIFSEAHWENAVAYIESHNVRRGEGNRPYASIPGWY